MILLIMCCVEFVSSCECVSKLQCRREACWLTRVWFSRQRRNCSAAGCAELMDAEPRLSLFWCPESDIHWCSWRLWFIHSWKKSRYLSLILFYPSLQPNRQNKFWPRVCFCKPQICWNFTFLYVSFSIPCSDNSCLWSGKVEGQKTFQVRIWKRGLSFGSPAAVVTNLAAHRPDISLKISGFVWWNVEGSHLSLLSHHHSSCHKSQLMQM